MALYELTNNNIDYSNITKAILIQKCNSKINYEKHMKYLLSQFCKPKYETYLAKKKYE